MRITFFITLLYFISTTAFAQTQNEDSITVIKPFDSFVIKNTAYLTDTSNSFKYSEYIWSDKRSLSEVMDQRPGYFVFDFFGLGGRNAITNNSLRSFYIGAFRDGLQVNDVGYGGVDIEIFSINEVEAVEEISATRSLMFGINSLGRSFNVITKDYFTPLPFSQLRYSQDRSNSLYADVFYSQAYSKKFGLQFGITKHSLDGRFENSAFDTWKTRTRLTLNINDRINLRANFYYNYIDRGLNGGAISGQSNDSLLSGDARVNSIFNVEDNEQIYYDVNLFARLFRDVRSLTKINLFSQNLIRRYTFKTAPQQPDFYQEYVHSLRYGLNTFQNIFIEHSIDFHSKIMLGFDIQLNKSDFGFSKRYLDIYSLKAAYELNHRGYSITGIYRFDRANDQNSSSFAIEANASLFNYPEFELSLSSGIRRDGFNFLAITRSRIIIADPGYNIFEAGVDLRYKDLRLKFYTSNYHPELTLWDNNGFHTSISYLNDWMGFNFIYQKNNSKYYPENYIKGNLFYKGILFNDNLLLRTGFEYKYYNIENFSGYDEKTHLIIPVEGNVPRPHQYLVDFFIGARIGNANINITVANIFNSLVYNAFIYPLDNRGGLLNAISRFTIVWDFLN